MDPFDEIRRMMNKMLFGTFSGEGLSTSLGGEAIREPLVDIREEENKLIVTAEVPGVEKKDIKLNIRKDDFGNPALVITARRQEQDNRRGASFQRATTFVKEVTLPTRVKKDKSKAKYHNGILEVELEKVKPSKVEDVTDIPVK